MEERSHYCFKRVSYSVRILELPPHRSICTIPIHPFPKQLTSKILYKALGESLWTHTDEYRTLGAGDSYVAQAHLVCPAVFPSGYAGQPVPYPRPGEDMSGFSREVVFAWPLRVPSVEEPRSREGRKEQRLTSPRFVFNAT